MVKNKGEIDSIELSELLKMEHQQVVGLLNGLKSKEVLDLEKRESKGIVLTEDGKNCLEKGSPDFQILKELKANGSQTKKSLIEKLGKSIMGYGFSLAMKSKLITYDKSSDKVSLKSDELPKEDKLQETVKKMHKDTDPNNYDEKTIKEYTKTHKFIKIGVIKSFLVKKGANFEGNEYTNEKNAVANSKNNDTNISKQYDNLRERLSGIPISFAECENINSNNNENSHSPSEEIMKKIQFLFGSVNKNNMKEKIKELKNILKEEKIIKWFSQFFVTKKLISENSSSFQMYDEILNQIDNKVLDEECLNSLKEIFADDGPRNKLFHQENNLIVTKGEIILYRRLIIELMENK